METLGQQRHGYRLLLPMMIIASLLHFLAAAAAAAVNENNQAMMINDKEWPHRRLLQEMPNPSNRSTSPPAPTRVPPPDNYLDPTPPSPPPPEARKKERNDTTPSTPPPPEPEPKERNYTPPATPPAPTTVNTTIYSKSRSQNGLVIGLVVAGLVLLCICGFCVYYWNSKTSKTVKPWMAGLSGQLQKAFLTGVPKLNRSELESACEEFSNVIGTSSIGKVYKGTLSSGAEIAVISLATDTVDNWSRSLKTQFRKKVEALSKINHKNFVNLIGYCEEDAPFTRMLVFEYAPNGTLYEHLHFQDSENLNWAMRLRISMGISYCLDHMHNLKPTAIHKNLISSAISLSEDYAAKVSDFTFWNEREPTEIQSARVDLNLMQPNIRSNITSFGKLLFETVTGKNTHLMSSEYIHSWTSDYLNDSNKVPDDIVDPTLGSVPSGEVKEILKVIQFCVQPDSMSKPSMKEVTAMLREITGITPDGASPKVSPLWWADLECITTDQS